MEDRVFALTPTGDLVATTAMILSIPRVDVDALIVFPGLERSSQIRHAIDVWNIRKDQHLIVAGYHEPEVAKQELVPHRLKDAYGLPEGEYLYSQVHAQNSKQQTEWVADCIKEINGVESVALFLPAFHIVRVYLAQLESFRRRGIEVCMIPMPTPIPPNRGVQLAPHEEQWDLMSGEVTRIPNYREKGDIATYGELRTYLDWMYEQPALQTGY